MCNEGGLIIEDTQWDNNEGYIHYDISKERFEPLKRGKKHIQMFHLL